MALSNKFGWMVLSTGNKSEMSVGLRHALWRHVRRLRGAEGRLQDDGVRAVALAQRSIARRACSAPPAAVMPERVITKPPSAELKPDQTDQDTLPPYEVLDDILRMPRRARDDGGRDRRRAAMTRRPVRTVWRMLDRAEYKRRQAPPGVKITRRAFGRDRRYPITNGFQDEGPVPVHDPGETPRAPAPSVT